MIEAIARLRKIADEAEGQARDADQAWAIRAEMMDLAVRWQWLAGEAAKLCTKSKELGGDIAACAECTQRCIVKRPA